MVAVVQQIKKKDRDRRYTLEEYFKLEEKAAYKSEFHNGKIIPVAGGTFNHNTLSGTFYGLFFMLFFNSKKEISVHTSDQKVYLEKYNKNVYTDTCVITGSVEMYQDGNQAILNPTLIVEVASKSTKFNFFQSKKLQPNFRLLAAFISSRVNSIIPIPDLLSTNYG